METSAATHLGAVIDLREVMDEADKLVKQTVQAVKSYRRLTDEDIGARMGKGRSHVQAYVSGSTKMTAGMQAALAKVLAVPLYVLSMPEEDAMRWIYDNAPNPPRTTSEQAARSTRWYTDRPSVAAVLPLRAA